MSHTPGPWMLRRDRWKEMEITTEKRIKECRVSICDMQVRFTEPFASEQLANARLIAAAPNLLDALKALFEDYKRLADSGDAGNWSLEDMPVGQQAMKAIAKAEGNNQGEQHDDTDRQAAA